MRFLSYHKYRAFELNIVHILTFLLPTHVSFYFLGNCMSISAQEVQFLDHAQVFT